MGANLLGSFASFLLENHVDDFVDLYLKRNKDLSLPIIDSYKGLNDSELKEQFKKETRLFLELLKNERGNDINIEWWNRMNLDKDSLNNLDEITLSDSILRQSIRKFVLIQLLSHYTGSAEKMLEIVKGLEDVFIHQEIYILQHFSGIQNVNSNEDFSDLSSGENKLKEEKNWLNEIESLAHVGYCEMHYSDETIQCSNGFRKIIGIDKSSKLTFSLLQNQTIRENGFDPFSKKLIQSFKGSRPNEHEFKIRSLDQSIKVLHSNDYPLKNEKGEIIGVKSFFQDITQIKQNEEQIRQSQINLHDVLESSPTIIFIYDIEKDSIIYSNWKESHVLGYSKENFFGKDYSEIILSAVHPDDKLRLIERRSRYPDLKEGEYSSFEFRALDSNGTTHWFINIALAFRRKNGKVTQVLINTLEITELKQKEEELRNREDKLIEAQKIGHIGSYDWDVVNDSIIISEELGKIFEFPPTKKEMTLSEFANLLRSDELPKFKKNFDKIHNTPVTYRESEYTLQMHDKREKYIILRHKIIRDPHNKPIRAIGTLMDITSLKKTYKELEEAQNQLKQYNAELEKRVEIRTKELKESEELYHTFIKQNSIGVWRFEFKDIPFIDTTLPVEEQTELMDKNIYVAEINQRIVSMLGYKSPKDFIGRKMSDMISISRETVFDIYTKAILSGYRLDEYELEVKDLNKNTIYLMFSAIGIVEGNKFIRGWGILRDVTDRRLATKALKASEERYRILAEFVPDIFLSAGVDGKINYFNKRWNEYTGVSSSEPKSIDWASFLHPDDIQKTIKAWNSGFQTGRIFEIEYRLKRFDGKYRWHLGRALPLKDEDGKIIMWIGTSTDIEEQKRFSEILMNKNEELVRLNNDLDNFIYSASHDLKGPINNIDGLLEALNIELQDECKSEETIGNILNMMSVSVDKFKKDLFDLIEITKARQRGEEGKEEINFYDLLKEIESTIESLIKDNDAQIVTKFEEFPVVKYSKKNLRSILYNLISNAIKYRSKDRSPEIIISTKDMKDYVLLEVKDNGLGFDSEQINKVFSQDNRFHKNVEGSGVGLFIIKRIIESVGGKIELESEKGKGSLFKVYIKKE